MKRLIAYFLTMVLLLGMFPYSEKKVEAASSSVTLANLGEMGSLSVGKKTKSGKWWKMYVGGGDEAFCLNLGYTCHTGDVYEDSSATYTSSSSGKKGLKACIGYWYAETHNHSNKAYVMAQALFWAVEEGDTSEDKLKNVITKVKSNTGYFDTKSAADLYKQIFKPSGTVSVGVKEYKYKGSGSHRQELLVITAGTKPQYKKIMQNIYYRQRIRIHKVDEDGNPMTGVTFRIEAENIDELYSYSTGSDAGSTDQDMNDFTVDEKTNGDGWISLRLTYHIYSDEYYYVPDSELSEMDSDGKKAVRDDLKDKGYKYASSLSKDDAEVKVAQDIMAQYDKVKNNYKITEVDSGNKNIVINPDYKTGKNIMLDDEYIWTNVNQVGGTEAAWSTITEKPYDIEVKDNYKKIKLSVKKADGYSKDNKEHGAASLDGAQFGVYSDAACKQPAKFVKADGSQGSSEFTTKNRTFETDYLRCGYTYYIKELKAPEGYKRNTKVISVDLDGSKYPESEWQYEPEKVQVDEQPILGKVAIQKYYSEGQSGPLNYEANTTFQVYLTRKGSYDACDDYERAVIKTDKNGYGITGDLYYGDYTVHQIDTGDVDAIPVDDFPVSVAEDGKTYTYPLDDIIFKAYLRILKKDGNTEKQVLKPGTVYEIYRVTEDGEKLVEQTYSNGNRQEKVSRFVTDETGEIMTVKELKSGTYRMYEVDSANGLHITEKYIEVTINSKADNYETFTDEDGYTHAVVTVTYINEETAGKLTIKKTGEQLADYKDGQFVYEEKQLEGVVFEIYADGDIATQDNQEGSTWFKDGDLVATVTTGEGAVFESECGGLTGYTMDDGAVTVNLPLGKYHVKEKKTLYGYVLPEEGWDVEFTWQNKDDAYVLNSTSATDENGILNVKNDRAGGKLSLLKADSVSGSAIEGAVFGVFTKDSIYNADGKKIVEAGTKLGSITTDKEGKAETDFDMPLMDEGYQPEAEGAVSGSAVSGGAVAGTGEKGLNSGDYYFREEEVADSYYLDDTEVPFHLEYKDAETPVIVEKAKRTNSQTTTEVDKTTVTGSEELPGCDLQITDKDGNVIVEWTSGEKESIKITDKELGYQNLSAGMTDDGHLVVGGLKHDTEYTLTERRPADGYATADSISFRLQESAEEKGKTLAALKNADGTYTVSGADVIHMVDDATKIDVSKTDITGSEELPGCDLQVTEKETGTVVESWTSTTEKHRIEQKLVVGKTYILTERRPADGYVTADSIEFTVMDTGEVQGVQMKDETTRIRFVKLAGDTGKGLRGAKIKVYDSRGKKVLTFISGKKGVEISGKLTVGETYTFKEVKAPKGYEAAKPVKYKVKDTAEVQTVSMKDKKIGQITAREPSGGTENQNTSGSPETGYMILILGLLMVGAGSAAGGIMMWRKGRHYGRN